MIRVAIADDHGIVREGLSRLIDAHDDMEVVGIAANGKQAAELCRDQLPEVILMDLEMPEVDGIQATRTIRVDTPSVAVLVLTSFSDRARILGALEAGACGYLLKDVDAEQIADAVRAAARGESPLDPRAASTVLSARLEPNPVSGLSAREREVLGLLVEGLPNKLIARRLAISEKTVKSHLTSVFRAIGATDRTQAALWAERNRYHLEGHGDDRT
ncbi:MAG: response regulator transcription factor [Solirubrobacteraceae bacterium]|nr:response regulator transcription factor [Solirubrobacteraceae bacterium]